MHVKDCSRECGRCHYLQGTARGVPCIPASLLLIRCFAAYLLSWQAMLLPCSSVRHPDCIFRVDGGLAQVLIHAWVHQPHVFSPLCVHADPLLFKF